MIEITLDKDKRGRVRSLLVEGHAGFSDSEHGGDIVCAAVSALVGYLGITLTELLPDLAELSADDGLFRLKALEASRNDSRFDVLLEGWIRSVHRLEENYKGWVKVEIRTI